MDLKFKVGDIVRNIISNEKSSVLDIVKNSYIFNKIDTNVSYHVYFDMEYNFVLISRQEDITTVSTNTCPQCNGELVEKYSEWAGKNINKCKSCGWC